MTKASYSLVILIVAIASFVLGKHFYKSKKIITNFIQNCPTFPQDVSRNISEKPTVKIKLHNFGGMKLASLPMLNDIISERYEIQYVDKDYDVLIDGVDSKQPLPKNNSLKIFYTWEPITPKIDNYDLAIGFDYIDHPKYIRLPLYYVFYRNMINSNFSRGQCDPSSKQHFASFLITNYGYRNGLDGCEARNRIFYKLSLYKNVASGGKALNNIGNVVPISDTFSWIATSKFMISYENQKHDGYMTEKPAQAYIGGAIPIWYGDKKALMDINPKSVIYADDFNTEDELVEYIKKVDNDDELYCKIWNEKFINDESKNYFILKETLSSKIRALIDDKLSNQN